ncbi:MAG: SMP-30/gluconolactonase/LRE family protein [Sphingobium sp.]
MDVSPTGPLAEFRVDAARMRFVGSDLHRPECILATPRGTLFTSDARGGVMRIEADGTQTLLGRAPAPVADQARKGEEWARSSLPNGIAFDGQGGIIIADVGAREIRRLTPRGEIETLHSHVDGIPLGIVNFILQDHAGRLWFTVTTNCADPLDAMNRRIADGYIGVIDARSIRIVADGFCGTNELRLDAQGEWLYVVESYGRRITRLRIGPDARLSHRETFGPGLLDPVPDGCAFDADGNLWVTCVFSEKIIAITPKGDVLTIMDEGDPAQFATFLAHVDAGTVTPGIMGAVSGNAAAPWISSLTFGGPDLRTVHIGTGKGSRIATFRSPVAGQPMAHWR